MTTIIEPILNFTKLENNLKKIKVEKAVRPTYPFSLEAEYISFLLSDYVNMYFRMYQERKDKLKFLFDTNPLKLDNADLKIKVLREKRIDQSGDALNSFWDTLQEDFRTVVNDPYLVAFIAPWTTRMISFNRSQVNRVVRSMIGVDLMVVEPDLRETTQLFIQNNVNLIRTIDQKFFDEVKNLTFKNYSQGKRWEEMNSDIVDRYKVSRSNAKRIARDQTSKINGQLTKLRQEEVGIEQYRWRTSGDERVRASHAAKEGRVFSWNKPPADTGHPTNDVQCRCSSEPVLEGLLGQEI